MKTSNNTTGRFPPYAHDVASLSSAVIVIRKAATETLILILEALEGNSHKEGVEMLTLDYKFLQNLCASALR